MIVVGASAYILSGNGGGGGLALEGSEDLFQDLTLQRGRNGLDLYRGCKQNDKHSFSLLVESAQA